MMKVRMIFICFDYSHNQVDSNHHYDEADVVIESIRDNLAESVNPSERTREMRRKQVLGGK